ncbi:unnamed protein product [Owenia fusiformis]|uniref:Uncharacterized protein n=1 Tax=Owenia fusiformis TaxID=6347 RepID=A0A8J1TLX9_OWEFU|nr:unnamed protein product [Owenia fusiformis]
MFQVLLLCGLIFGCQSQALPSYFPAFIQGDVVSAKVVALKESDYRGKPVYEITFTVKPHASSESEGIVHRQYEEFQKFNDKRPFKIGGYGFNVPKQSEANITMMDAYLQRTIATDSLKTSQLMSDFLGINWDGKNIKWFLDMAEFMKMLLNTRVPDFAPEPPIIRTEEDVLHEETPHEVFVYLTAFHHGHSSASLQAYQSFFKNYTELTPKFDGPTGETDVLPPGVSTPIKIPYFYDKAHVHFLPGGYLNGQTVRISYLGKNKFNMLKEVNLRDRIKQFHGQRSPKMILDVGTGNCFSAFSFAEVFPNSIVHGVDLAAPYVRFCRVWQKARQSNNTFFYQDNGESLHYKDNTFDIVQYTYVLHEMPAENAARFLKEAFRVLKPGGVISGFEVPYVVDPVERPIFVETQTWGYKWNTTGPHGPEPFVGEFELGTKLPQMIKSVGFINMIDQSYTEFDHFYIAEKPKE